MNMKYAMRCATAVSLALVLSTSYAAGDGKNTSTQATDKTSQPMTGKQKATAIGAGTGAVAGAVVGGPVGAVVGAGIGGYVGHEGTDANGKVSSTPATSSSHPSHAADSTVRNAQAALNDQGYSVARSTVNLVRTRKAPFVASRRTKVLRKAVRSTALR